MIGEHVVAYATWSQLGLRPMDGRLSFSLFRKCPVHTHTSCNIFFSINLVCSVTSEAFVVRQTRRANRWLSDRFVVEPVAMETSGILGHRPKSLFTAIGEEMVFCKCEPHGSDWLLQSISFAIFRSNVLIVSVGTIRRFCKPFEIITCYCFNFLVIFPATKLQVNGIIM